MATPVEILWAQAGNELVRRPKTLRLWEEEQVEYQEEPIEEVNGEELLGNNREK